MWRRSSLLDSTWKGDLEACSQEEPRLEVISKGRAGTPLWTREQGFFAEGDVGKHVSHRLPNTVAPAYPQAVSKFQDPSGC